MKSFASALTIAIGVFSSVAYAADYWVTKTGKISKYVTWKSQERVVLVVAGQSCYIDEEDDKLHVAATMAKGLGATVEMVCYPKGDADGPVLDIGGFIANKVHRLTIE